MGEEKIAAFYDDPVKQACDAWAMEKAWSFRSVSIDESIYWRLQRWARFANLACPRAVAPRRLAAGGDLRRSLLVIVVIIIVIKLAVVVRLSRVERVALVVPELAVDAIPGKQLLMRAALDRPAP
jgi:hypothetical protein